MSDTPSVYETENMLHRYLLFHYGSKHDLLPFDFGPFDSLYFPIRCVRDCLNTSILPNEARALDIGCAVGRSSFELAKYCKYVFAIDYSAAFIRAAQELQTRGSMEYFIFGESGEKATRLARLPKGVNPKRVEFFCCDAMDLPHIQLLPFNVVLAANVLCRVSDPRAFLKQLPYLVAKEGQLILTSPYSWLEKFTSEDNWLISSKKTSIIDLLQDILKKSFQLVHFFDLPFLLRDHYRKYEWGVTQASIWKRL